MGVNYLFSCKSCGYSVDVSGGPDIGMQVATRTISCLKCKELYDVVVSEDAWEKDEPKQGRKEPKCPKSEKHSVVLWIHPGQCPKCRGTMEMGEMTRLWD